MKYEKLEDLDLGLTKMLDKLQPDGPTDPNQIIAYSIALALNRIADEMAEIKNCMKEIKNGMSFICERWSSK